MATSFICKNCNKPVRLDAPGTHHRNHCPYCLSSTHVDVLPGDRSSACGGIMLAVAKIYKPDGEEVIVHKCQKCGFIRKNRVAGDDSTKAIKSLPVLDFVGFEEALKNPTFDTKSEF